MDNISARISRSLVTVIFLSLVQVIAGPILAPQVSTPVALATTPGIEGTNLALDVNAADTTDMSTTNMNYGGSPSPTFTATGGGYYALTPGNSQYLVPKSGVTLNANKHISVFMWVYPQGEGQLLTQLGTQTINADYHTAIIDYSSTDQMHFGLWRDVGDQSSVNGSTTIATPKNNWYYVGLVYDGTKVTAYINGVQAGQSPNFTYAHPATSYFGIGAYDITTINQGASYGNMRFGALHVYKSALTGTQVANNFAATTGRFGPTVSNPSNASTFVNRTATFTSSACTNTTSGSATCNYQWQLSTDSGTTWNFISGATSFTYTTPILTSADNGKRYRLYAWDPGTGSTTANDLYTITSAATLTVTTPPGSDTDSALSLNGSTQYAEISDTTGSPFDTSGTFTIQAWVNPATGCASAQTVIAKYLSYMLECYNGYWWYMNIANGSTGSDAATLIKVEQDEWHHIALTRSSGSQNLNFYYDGVLVQTLLTGVTNMTPNNQPFRIGQYNNNYFFNGMIDEVRIYNSQRTQAQIVQDMNSYGNVNDSELMVYYDFNEFTGSKLYNRKAGATSASDLDILNSPLWKDVKIVDSLSLPAYTIVKFPRSYLTVNGGWRVPTGATRVSALVVAGGGGGGARAAGGGGAGGLVYRQTLTLSVGAVESITVGHGGLGGYSMPTFTNRQGLNGGDSQLGTHTGALGGGGGGGAGDAGNTYRTGLNGGSGGGASGDAAGGGASAAFGYGQQASSKGYGLGSNGGSGMSGTYWNGGGGGGSGGPGQNASTTSWVAGNGGAGTLDPVGGSNLCLAAGGGGGTINTGTSAGAGGTCASGTVTAGAGTVGAVIAGSATANSGSGGGGSGYQSTDVGGGHGGSGVIIIRWITAAKPSFTAPTIAYLNVGMTETFTTNVAQDSATVNLTRTFRWESSTTGVNGTYSVIKQGTGAQNAFFSWVPTDTSTSGSTFAYRVIVTDSDTAGLFIVETSTPVWAIINPTLTMTGRSSISKSIGVSKLETFTVGGGTSTFRYTLTPDSTFFWLDTATATTPRLRIADTATVGTYLETITVTDSVSASVTIPLTIKISPPPSFSSNAEQVDNGTVLYLDSGNSTSYSGSGNSWSDLSGAGLSTSLAPNMTGRIASTYPICTAPTFSTDALGAVNFTSTATSLQCAYTSNLGLLERYTLDVWVKRNGPQTSEAAVISTPYSAAGKQVNIALFWSDTTTITAGVFNGSTWIKTLSNSGVVIPDNTWANVVVLYNGTNLRIIVNGDTNSANLVSAAVTWDLAKLDSGLLIGRKWGDDIGFKGSIGSIRVYNRTLTMSEVTQNYNATRGRFEGTANKNRVTGKYGTTVNETFTVTAGSESLTASFTSNAISGLRWDTSTVRSLKVQLQESLTAGPYLDTVTVTDIYGVSSRIPLTFVVSKADTITVTAGPATTKVFDNQQATSLPAFSISGLVASDTGTVLRKFTGIDWTKPCSQGGGCEVGDTGPGGGTIFYISPSAINAATGISSGGRYLEVAPINWSGLSVESTTAWAKVQTSVTGTSSAIGSGAENTRLINTALGTNSLAAKIAADLTFGGKSDWFLPSTLEVKEMYDALYAPSLAGNLSVRNYWSSTQGTNAAQADTYWFGGGGLVSTTDKLNSFTLRPIRAYSPDTITVTTVPTNVDSYTVFVDTVTLTSGSLSNYEGVIYQRSGLDITQARQDPLRINTFGATFGVPYRISALGGSGSGAITETLIAGSTATGCAISGDTITSTTAGICNIQIKKAYSRNYLTETATAMVYFLLWVINQPSPGPGSGPNIALNGENTVTVDAVGAPTITSLSATTISLSTGGSLTIGGTGFGSSLLTVKFWRDKSVTITPASGTSIVVPFADIAAAGAQSGRIMVITAGGTGVSVDRLTINP